MKGNENNVPIYSRILDKVKSYDFFGVEYRASIFGERRHKSLIGFILTFFLVFLCFFRTIQVLSEILNKNNFMVSENNISELNIPHKLDNLSLSICSPIGHLSSYEYNISSELDLNLINYSSNYYETSSLLPFDLECNTYDLSNISIQASTIMKNQISLYIKVTSINKTDESDFYIFFYYDYVDANDYVNSIKNRFQLVSVGKVSGFRRKIELLFSSLNVIHKNILQFLVFNFSSKNQVQSTTYENVLKTDDISGDKDVVEIYIKHSGWAKTITFIGYDLGECISELGGFFNIMIMLFNFIGHIVNKVSLSSMIEKEFKNNHSFYRKKCPLQAEPLSERVERKKFMQLDNYYSNKESSKEKSKSKEKMQFVELEKNRLYYNEYNLNINNNDAAKIVLAESSNYEVCSNNNIFNINKVSKENAKQNNNQYNNYNKIDDIENNITSDFNINNFTYKKNSNEDSKIDNSKLQMVHFDSQNESNNCIDNIQFRELNDLSDILKVKSKNRKLSHETTNNIITQSKHSKSKDRDSIKESTDDNNKIEEYYHLNIKKCYNKNNLSPDKNDHQKKYLSSNFNRNLNNYNNNNSGLSKESLSIKKRNSLLKNNNNNSNKSKRVSIKSNREKFLTDYKINLKPKPKNKQFNKSSKSLKFFNHRKLKDLNNSVSEEDKIESLTNPLKLRAFDLDSNIFKEEHNDYVVEKKIFEQMMDYEVIYFCIKELKLLEYLLLDSKTGAFFFGKINNNIDLLHINQVMYNEIINNRFTNDLNKKIELFNKLEI